MKKRIALLGMPNTGKSTFFNRLTGSMARTGNWPGVTVDLMSARMIVGGHLAEVIDLPGIYDLRGFSDDEEVVRRFLANNPVDLVAIIVNSVQVERQLHLAAQVRALGLPAVIVLNMQDEADDLAIRIDQPGLAGVLGMPVISLSAKHGRGMGRVEPLFDVELSKGRPPVVVPDLLARLPEESEVQDLVRAAQRYVHVPERVSDEVTNRIDKVLLHPWLGLPIFFAILYLLFEGVYTFSAPIQDLLDGGLGWVKETALVPLLSPLPDFVRGLLLDGLWDGFVTVAAFVPVIVMFFLFMALVEDTGYFSRAAYLMDSFMARLGLDGRGFVMILMGFGCNVPALMGTRVMRSRGMRLLTMMIIPLSLCSARLQVFLFLVTILFSPERAPLVLFSLYLMSVGTALLTALLFRKQFAAREPFVLELPPYRLPTLRMMWSRGFLEVRHFLKRATKFIAFGVVMVWLLTHLPWGVAVAGPDSLAGKIGHFFNPILSPLGINDELAITLIFGFVAKEIVVGAMAVIYGLEGDALSAHIAQNLDWVSAYSFMLFTLIYTPCLSTIATIYAESKSRWYTALALAWPMALAWMVSFVFYQGARALGF